MTTSSFEKDSLDWKLQQIQQQLGEWWELQLKKFNFGFSNPSIPSWEGWNWLWESLEKVLLILLSLLIIWVIWRIVQRLFPYFRTLRTQLNQSGDIIGNLVEKESSVIEWLKRSRKFQQQGDYYRACRCLYLAMLQQLHDTGIAPHQGSRTDEEYRLLILQLPQPDSYETLFKIHQQLCFGSQEASVNIFVRCQQACREIGLNT
jgi:hypothetical protein